MKPVCVFHGQVFFCDLFKYALKGSSTGWYYTHEGEHMFSRQFLNVTELEKFRKIQGENALN